MPPYTKRLHMIEELTRRIESGEYPSGAKLPSGKQLAIEFEVSMMVVRQAVDWLKARGMAEGVPGKGVYVVGPEKGE